jgi:hypothetical protein
LGVAIPAGAIGGRTATCKGEAAKPTVHADATRREATLGDLVSKLQKRRDVFGLNGPQISTLQQASAGVSALDQQIASTCYPTLAAFRADAVKLFVGYRVYWLRVPQSHAIEAADRLGEVRARLGDVAAKLTTYAGSNEQAQVDLAAMHRALDAADAKLGTAPNAGPSIAAIAGLAPAADMTADEAALRAAHTDLVAIRSSLVDARSAAQRVVADLRG